MERWEVQEKHWKDLNEIYDRLEFYWPGTHKVGRFDGARFFPAAAEKGHTTNVFENCKCFKEWKEKNPNK